MNLHIGEKIRKFRKEVGLTQTQLAQGIVTPSMICQIEAGKATPSYPVLEAIAERLGRPISAFLNEIQPNGKHKATLLLAQALLRKQEYTHACTLLESLYQEEVLQVSRDDVQINLATCYLALEKYEEAQSLLDDLLTKSLYVKKSPLAFTCLIGLADLARATEKKQVALYHLRKAYMMMQQEPEISPYLKIDLLYRLGSLYQELGYGEEAHQCYQMAYEWGQSIHTEKWEETHLLQKSLESFQRKDYEDTFTFAEKANILLEHKQQQVILADVLRSHACMLAERGKYHEAVSQLQECLYQYKACGEAEGIVATELELVKLYLHQGLNKEAEESLLKIEPLLKSATFENALFYHLKAQLFLQTGQYDEVLSHFAKALHMYQQQGAYDACSRVIQETATFYKQWESKTFSPFAS